MLIYLRLFVFVAVADFICMFCLLLLFVCCLVLVELFLFTVMYLLFLSGVGWGGGHDFILNSEILIIRSC